MKQFQPIAIIYNPNSTGPSKTMAAELSKELRAALPKASIKLIATKKAGHAEELAYDLATKTSRPLIISASGDGGYHEVVNGLLQAQKEGAHPTAGLLPAGNANDHYHDVHTDDIVKSIASGKSQKIDVLKLSGTMKGKPFIRYAHSYIGIGLTPQAGKELNKTSLKFLSEIRIVLNVLVTLRPARLVVQGKVRTFDSLVFSNVGTMSKVLSLADDASNKDGKFEVTAFRRRNKLRLIGALLRATTVGLKDAKQLNEYTFSTTQPLLIQLDGEVYTLDAKSDVVVSIEPQVLCCIV